MSRGRKQIALTNSNWENVFYNSVGTYVQYINQKLGKHFKSEPLSNHIRIAGGYAFKSSEYKKEGIPVIRISDFNKERIILDDVVYYDESEELKKFELYQGDIVIALTGGTIAKLGIVQEGIGKLYLNQRVGKFEVLNHDEFETEYVYWIARSVQSIIKNLAWGAAIPNVSPRQIEELEFPIPDKKTQRGIIDFLNALKLNDLENDKEYFNNEIESNILLLQINQVKSSELQSEQTYQLDLLKKLRQQILQDAVQGKLIPQDPNDEPASKLLEQIKEVKEKLVKEKKIKKDKPLPEIKPNEIPFEIPVNWGWCRLSEIFKFIDYRGKTPTRISEGVRLISAKNIRFGYIDNHPIEYISALEYDKWMVRGFPQNGDILFVTEGHTMGFVAIIDLSFKYALAQRTICLQPFIYNYSRFVFYLLMSPIIQKVVKKMATGSAAMGVQSAKLKDMLISLPPITEQHRIVAKVEQLIKLCDELEQTYQQNQKYTHDLLKVALKEALEPKTN